MNSILIHFISIFLIIVLFLSPSEQEQYEKKRIEMINKQIISRGIKDKNILNALKTVERHLFVPEEYKNRAYEDRPLPIGYGQTISQPYIVAYMTELLNIEPNDTVLEIGCGSGYQAAILSEIANQVYTIEIIEELGISAKERLQNLEFKNIETKIDDGYYGWEEHSPFDAIVVTAASEYIPPPLINQLKDGGKMVIPIGSPFGIQTLMLVTKHGAEITTKRLLPVRFVPFTRKK